MSTGGAVGRSGADFVETDAARRHLYRKIGWRIIPLLIVCYIASMIDRANISIAQIPMSKDLGLSATAYGVGIAAFFLGYIACEIPSNVYLHKYGARLTFLRIMVVWGIVTFLSALIRTEFHFYLARFLLGLAEAGFYPGVLLYLTYWFPPNLRARMVSLILLAPPLSSFVGQPLSALFLVTLDGRLGLHGWQWMFMLQGVPTILLGFLAYRLLADRPENATWLTAEEKAIVAHDLQQELDIKLLRDDYGFRQMFSDPRIYFLCLTSCCVYAMANIIVFWTPLMLKQSGVENILSIGFLAMIPPAISASISIAYARHSDHRAERRWHFATAQLCGASFLLLASIFPSSTVMTLLAISLMTAAHFASSSIFAAISSTYLSVRARAAGMALLTTVGAASSLVTPIFLGQVVDRTGSTNIGLRIFAAVIIAGAVMFLLSFPARLLRER